MGKVIGGERAEAFFGDWRRRIQQNHKFPLHPEVSQALKAEYRAWYKTNLGIERTDAHASSALQNCDPSKAGKKKVCGFVYFSFELRVCCCCLSRSDILNQDTEAAHRISLTPLELAAKQKQSRDWKAVRAIFIC